MDNSVVIKGNKNGIVVVLDPKPSFDEIKKKVGTKFADSAKFLGSCKTAVAFEGRDLSDEEQLELIDIITTNTELDIVCLLDTNVNHETAFAEAVNDCLMEKDVSTARFYKGNIRSGQNMECENSIIVIGDVNPGAGVISNGNIIILGSLKGTAFAGASGNANAFVFALDMNPMQIRIADIIARAPDSPDRSQDKEPRIAFLEDENIYIEKITKSVLNDIKL